MLASMPSSSPETGHAQAPSDVPAEDRVHHHARVDGEGRLSDSGHILTLCGLRLAAPRPEAAQLPCCPMCALTMGRPCS